MARGSDHEQPVCDSTKLSPPERSNLVQVRKALARKAFEAALGRELHEILQEAKKMASQIQQSSDLWDLEHYLTQRRKEIERKYDYRPSSRLIYEDGIALPGRKNRHVFIDPLRERNHLDPGLAENSTTPSQSGRQEFRGNQEAGSALQAGLTHGWNNSGRDRRRAPPPTRGSASLQ